MYYYKHVDADGNTDGVISCNIPLATSEYQLEATKEEYDTYIASIPEPEPKESALDDALNALSVMGYTEG